MTKADKLIDRGSESPRVAHAASCVSDMLLRMYLAQPKYFAEAVERALPDLTELEADRLCGLFSQVAWYFKQRADGVRFPEINQNLEAVRQWETGDGAYRLLRVFAVLACDLPYCADHMDCWETRRAFCEMDGKDNSEVKGQQRLANRS